MDVNYLSSDWEKMRSSTKSLIGYGIYGKGIFEHLKKLNKVLEEAEEDIAKYDVDGAISFSHTSQESTYQMLFEKFEILNHFTGKVGDLVDRTIDQPFYEDMDAFVSAMEEATISNYTTTNRIGATEMQTVGYEPVTVVEVPKTTVSLDDLLSGGNFYSNQMQLEYEEWKKVNPDQDLSQSEFQLARVNMRAFEYESIRDHQENKEFWTQIGALVVIVGVTLLCPPAGLVLGAAYGVMELNSAVSGEDWVSGRELGTGERWFRGLLAPLDILPVGVFSRFAANGTKLGRLTDHVGSAAMKSGIKEGVQQGTNQIGNIVDGSAKYIPSRLASANAATGDHVPVDVLKQAAGDELNSAVSSVPPSLNIPSTRKISDWADDVVEVNKNVPDTPSNKADDMVRQTDNAEIPVREISPEDRAKLDQWAYPPDEQKYLQYKEVYDNPQYYNQENGAINWPSNNGFDGESYPEVLPAGTVIDRYGGPEGIFVSPANVPYEQRALALHSDEAPYHKYRLVEPFEVQAGKIAEWFGRPGGGIQYYLGDLEVYNDKLGIMEKATVEKLIELGYITEIF
jgi:predicted ribonuclease toxin of YeeF-YezG toxin-antitoxin module